MFLLTCPRVDLSRSGCLSRQLRRPGSGLRCGARCMVSATRNELVLGQGGARMATIAKPAESSSGSFLISSLLEVVSGDLRRLTENLKSCANLKLTKNLVGRFLALKVDMSKLIKFLSWVPPAELPDLSSLMLNENPVLISAAEQIFGAGGKRLRPALVFLVSRATAQIVGMKDLSVQHQRLAEIIEMIHTASLIHDDVLDDSAMRRGRETIHQTYGTRVAVLAGDFMFAQSSWYLANLENIEVIKLISQVIKDFASGEIKQASGLFDCELTLENYLLKSYYKTASLIAASSKSAAIFSSVSTSICEQMFEYGRNLGLSFQVVDDILDFTQSTEQLGKPAGSDLSKGNLTAPVIFALEKEPKLREIIDSEFSEVGSLEEAIKLIHQSGGLGRAQELAKQKAEMAIQSLQCLPESEFRDSLEVMVRYNLERID